MEWQEGRNLTKATKSGTEINYTYDHNGLRTSKDVNGTVHTYYYASGKLLRETYSGNTLDFFYDANGTPFALRYNGSTFYYITNLQGDVIKVVQQTGQPIAEYEYAPFGGIVSATGDLAAINPLRYRGYYYDTDSGFYYLNSRYYDPETGRFLNADSYASTGQGIIGHNMFAYCNNNPINMSDPTGELGLMFWSFVSVVGISAGANAVSTYIAGGSTEECIKAAVAGGVGAAVGFGVSMATGFTPQGNVLGRAAATAVSDLGTALLTKGTLTAEDYVQAGIDAVMDMTYSAVGYYYTTSIKSDLVQSIVNTTIDAITDVSETYLFLGGPGSNANVSPQNTVGRGYKYVY